MPAQPRSIPTLKGALVSVGATSGALSVVAFQYNPSTLRRTLKPLMVGGETGDRSEAVRFTGAPEEIINVEIDIDATDQLEAGDATALQSGINPQLAALSLLLYPSSSQITYNATLLEVGTIEIAPMTAPRTLFVWGPKRVLPVRLQSVTITEEEFDTMLNPIRASIALEMRTLTYSDLTSSNPDYHQYLAYQQGLESIAQSAVSSQTDSLGQITISN